MHLQLLLLAANNSSVCRPYDGSFPTLGVGRTGALVRIHRARCVLASVGPLKLLPASIDTERCYCHAGLAARQLKQQEESGGTIVFPGCTFLQDSELARNPDYSTLFAALQATGVATTLNNLTSPATLFAPTNEAFAEFFEASNTTAAQALSSPLAADILLYHLVSGAYMVSRLQTSFRSSDTFLQMHIHIANAYTHSAVAFLLLQLLVTFVLELFACLTMFCAPAGSISSELLNIVCRTWVASQMAQFFPLSSRAPMSPLLQKLSMEQRLSWLTAMVLRPPLSPLQLSHAT